MFFSLMSKKRLLMRAKYQQKHYANVFFYARTTYLPKFRPLMFWVAFFLNVRLLGVKLIENENFKIENCANVASRNQSDTHHTKNKRSLSSMQCMISQNEKKLPHNKIHIPLFLMFSCFSHSARFLAEKNIRKKHQPNNVIF